MSVRNKWKNVKLKLITTVTECAVYKLFHIWKIQNVIKMHSKPIIVHTSFKKYIIFQIRLIKIQSGRFNLEHETSVILQECLLESSLLFSKDYNTITSVAVN